LGASHYLSKELVSKEKEGEENSGGRREDGGRRREKDKEGG
jgi:hypothetical protein